MVVVGGANQDDGRSGAEALMNALDAGIRAEVASGGLTQDEYDVMSIPRWNRTLAEFTAPFDDGGRPRAHPVESELDFAPDAYLAAYREDHDAQKFGAAVSAFLRAFTEPSLFAGLSSSGRSDVHDRRPRVRPRGRGGGRRPGGDGDPVARRGAPDRQARLSRAYD